MNSYSMLIYRFSKRWCIHQRQMIISSKSKCRWLNAAASKRYFWWGSFPGDGHRWDFSHSIQLQFVRPKRHPSNRIGCREKISPSTSNQTMNKWWPTNLNWKQNEAIKSNGWAIDLNESSCWIARSKDAGHGGGIGYRCSLLSDKCPLWNK